MLKLTNIKKSYKTADFTQIALNDISISFRDNEFAAILGPSGSGKTTMLNIVGGLDQYELGDLEIEGTSTKEFKDHDWDTYRNNRIGFVFQSYNLIPHQTVLANVELALTLSGVSINERHERAKQALTEVGLGDHVHKKPSQLSGGQMQRVAIARALINDPEILLADEPTGALDTKTSTQVMDLLSEIAKDRLVIMVTHNSELAKEYANRVVHLKDGDIVSDTNPFDPHTDEVQTGREIRKSSMSFMTAVSLSFSNLMTKKGRTLVTALAGSIGIIGIAAIIALANGINAYIRSVEEDTLSLYPLTIQTVGFDLGGLIGGHEGGTRVEVGDGLVQEARILENMFALRSNNDLASLKVYFEDNWEFIDPLVNAIHYMYDITPHIFLSDTNDEPQQVNPDPIFANMGMGGDGMGAMMGFGGGFGMNVFSEMPGNIEMFEQQYDILAGYWPDNYDEAILILSHSGRLSDLELYSMGLRDRAILADMMDALMTQTVATLETDEGLEVFTYDELLAVEFRVVNPFDMFQYDDTFNVWIDQSENDDFMRSLLEDSTTLRIVGIARPSPTATATALSSGINFTPELIDHLMIEAANAGIVLNQMANPRVNVFTGRTFADEAEENVFDFSRLISIDEEAIDELLAIEVSAMELDFSNFSSNFDFDFDYFDFDLDFNFDFDLNALNFDLSGFDFDFDVDASIINFDMGALGDLDFDVDFDLNLGFADVTLPPFPIDDLTGDLAGQFNIPTDALLGVITGVMQDFFIEAIQSDITDPADLILALTDHMAQPTVQEAINTGLLEIIEESAIQEQIINFTQVYVQETVGDYVEQLVEILQIQIQDQTQQLQNQVGLLQNQIQQPIAEATSAMIEELTYQVAVQMEQVTSQMTPQIGDVSYMLGSQMETVTDEMAVQMETVMAEVAAQMETVMAEAAVQIEEAMTELTEQFEGIDPDLIADAFQLEMDEEEIFLLMTAMMNPIENTYERNLELLGFADPEIPAQINIYPQNFESKEEILDILDSYNERMEALNQPEKVIQYTDLVGALMSSVTDIINMISHALIAFVAISLVVSSIMIGVITYISVLERKKEIGILRAIGASKSNIRRVFNAETLIVGFVAGVLGVLITLIIIAIANVIVLNRFDIERIARLPASAMLILVVTSMFLTFIAGLIPSSAAARKDPIEALRSE